MLFKKIILPLVSIAFVLGMSSCAHQTKIQPSKGHIDGQNTSANQKEAMVSADSVPAEKPVATSVIPMPVTHNTYLPPPKPKTKEQVYSIVVYDTPVKEVLFAIARDSKLNIDIHPSIQGNVTLNAVDQTLPAILERLSRQVDLTYKIQNNVLTITPDQPVLRTYKVDYVNITRDTKGFIGAAAEISGTGQGANISNAGGSVSNSGNGANNSSSTSVSSEAKNHLWDSLIQNIKDLLAEADKEVIITRFGSLVEGNVQPNKSHENGASKPTSQAENAKAIATERDQQRLEYKTLFAAKVIANPETGVISVRATNKQHEKVQEFIDRVLNSAKRQVLIEATIVEVTLNDGFQSGIDWSRLNNPGNSGFTFSQSFTPEISASASNIGGTAGLVAGYLNPVSRVGNIAASVTLLKQFGDAKVLSSPKLMVLNNQTAILKVVDNLVYFTVQSQISQSTVLGGANLQSVTTTANTVPVGVIMSVTPQVNENGAVNIDVRPTITSFIRYVKDPNPQIAGINNQGIPEIQVREMESMLLINSGNTAVLGGLMQDVINANTDKVPGLSDISGLGEAFTGRNYRNKKTELVIFLRPTVIGNASLESDELSSYKQYLPAQQLKHSLDTESER